MFPHTNRIPTDGGGGTEQDRSVQKDMSGPLKNGNDKPGHSAPSSISTQTEQK